MVETLFLGSIFCALLSMYILLFNKNSFKSYSNYLLVLFYLFSIARVAIYLLVFTGLINKMPFLYKTTAPLNFLTPVLSYLYVRSVLYNESKFTLKDIPHFIPAIFFFISYLPFYLLPISEKTIIVKSIVSDNNVIQKLTFGIIPENLFLILIPLQATIYLILQCFLIYNFKKINKQLEVQNQINIIIKWVKIFSISIAFIVIGYFILIIGLLNKPNFINNSDNYLISGLFLSISFFIISTYLLVNPNVLSGLPFIKYKKIDSNILDDKIHLMPFIEIDYSKEIKLINDYLVQDQPYLKNNLNISIVAVDLKIPVRELSYIINNFYGCGFNDFINKHRIEYMIKKLNTFKYNLFTIDSLSKEAGFAHKSSFYRAFKKEHFITPQEYFQHLI